MNLPEFTAEASLYRSHERYQHPASGLQSNSGEVLPQRWEWTCFINCIYWGNDQIDCARGCGVWPSERYTGTDDPLWPR